MTILSKPTQSGSDGTKKGLDVFFVLLGVVGLIFKGHYSGSLEEIVHSYAGNITVSFAVYFIAKQIPFYSKPKRLLTACLALVPVELFELFDGFGVMTNVYDPIDLFVNVVGILLALAVDTALSSRQQAGE